MTQLISKRGSFPSWEEVLAAGLSMLWRALTEPTISSPCVLKLFQSLRNGLKEISEVLLRIFSNLTFIQFFTKFLLKHFSLIFVAIIISMLFLVGAEAAG